jgi:hypothetical protein
MMGDANQFGSRGTGASILNEAPTKAPTPKVMWGFVAGAVVTIGVWALRQFAKIDMPAEISAACVVVVTFLMSYITPPAGFSGDYGKGAGGPVLALLLTVLAGCSFMPDSGGGSAARAAAQSPRGQLLMAEYSTAAAFNTAASLFETKTLGEDAKPTVRSMQEAVSTSLDAARQAVNQGQPGTSQLAAVNAALTRLIFYLEEKKVGKPSAGLTGPQRLAYLDGRGIGRRNADQWCHAESC